MDSVALERELVKKELGIKILKSNASAYKKTLEELSVVLQAEELQGNGFIEKQKYAEYKEGYGRLLKKISQAEKELLTLQEQLESPIMGP